MRVLEALRQVLRVRVDDAQPQVHAPLVEGALAHQSRERGEELRLPHVEVLRVGRADLFEERGPVETRRELVELRAGRRIVHLVRIALLDARHRRVRERVLELVHGLGRSGSRPLVVAEQHADRGEMRAVLVLDRARLLVVLQVVVAVRQTEAALHEVDDVLGARERVGHHAQGESRAHAVPLKPAEQRRQVVARRDAFGAAKDVAQAREARPLDALLVQAARVEIADELLVPGPALARRILEDLVEHGEVSVADLAETAPAGLVVGDRRGGEPRAIRVLEEVVARPHRFVHELPLDRTRRVGPRTRIDHPTLPTVFSCATTKLPEAWGGPARCAVRMRACPHAAGDRGPTRRPLCGKGRRGQARRPTGRCGALRRREEGCRPRAAHPRESRPAGGARGRTGGRHRVLAKQSARGNSGDPPSAPPNEPRRGPLGHLCEARERAGRTALSRRYGHGARSRGRSRRQQGVRDIRRGHGDPFRHTPGRALGNRAARRTVPKKMRWAGTQAATVLWRVFLDAILPLAVAYLVISWLTDTSRIDTGLLKSNSLLMNARPIFRSIAQADVFVVAVESSAILLLTAMGGAMLVGIPLGILYGWSTNRALKAAGWSLSTVLVALPAFFWAVALELTMIWIYLNLGWRYLPIAGFGVDEHLVLPSLALGARPAVYIFRLTATAVEEIRHTDYIRTANAKGLRERTMLTHHVLPNAAPNIIAAVVLATRGAISSLVIIEFVYIWGGAALVFVQALGNRRLELALSLAFTFAIASALLTVVAEMARARMRVTT